VGSDRLKLWKFAAELTTPEIETKIAELERMVCQSHPEVIMLFVKPQSSVGFKGMDKRHLGGGET
jgi:hypothetical protein